MKTGRRCPLSAWAVGRRPAVDGLRLEAQARGLAKDSGAAATKCRETGGVGVSTTQGFATFFLVR
jgi:hypothetical protein